MKYRNIKLRKTMKNFTFSTYATIFLSVIAIISCTDPVKIKLKEGRSEVAVDGSITDQSKVRSTPLPDTVRLTRTNGYLSGPAPVISNALVIINDNMGNRDTLQYTSNGKYVTHVNKITGAVGRNYELTVEVDGQKFHAADLMPRVTNVDSLVTDYRTEPQYGRSSGYFINLYAKDLVGEGDFYRLKVYKNGILYNRPLDLNIAADAGFSDNKPIDGLRFIWPIREFLNPTTNVVDPATSGDMAPYIPGDTVTVEILSLSTASYYFYTQLQRQLLNDGLFASPAANVVTNITNSDPQSSVTAVGWFNASALSSKSLVIKKKD